eukprot:TRINITY_DN7110_c0_g1_i1.p1 TRINITY_DN7110_c0_g1~~TRINITY_DN7110_c0_g1_i1.p1  ORF type:complete len:782 (+),score=211.84 TRINITY_DN7110_c0_g1_i1:318-2348(+)
MEVDVANVDPVHAPGNADSLEPISEESRMIYASMLDDSSEDETGRPGEPEEGSVPESKQVHEESQSQHARSRSRSREHHGSLPSSRQEEPCTWADLPAGTVLVEGGSYVVDRKLGQIGARIIYAVRDQMGTALVAQLSPEENPGSALGHVQMPSGKLEDVFIDVFSATTFARTLSTVMSEFTPQAGGAGPAATGENTGPQAGGAGPAAIGEATGPQAGGAGPAAIGENTEYGSRATGHGKTEVPQQSELEKQLDDLEASFEASEDAALATSSTPGEAETSPDQVTKTPAQIPSKFSQEQEASSRRLEELAERIRMQQKTLSDLVSACPAGLVHTSTPPTVKADLPNHEPSADPAVESNLAAAASAATEAGQVSEAEPKEIQTKAPAAKVWNPATGEYIEEEVPDDIKELFRKEEKKLDLEDYQQRGLLHQLAEKKRQLQMKKEEKERQEREKARQELLMKQQKEQEEREAQEAEQRRLHAMEVDAARKALESLQQEYSAEEQWKLAEERKQQLQEQAEQLRLQQEKVRLEEEQQQRLRLQHEKARLEEQQRQQQEEEIRQQMQHQQHQQHQHRILQQQQLWQQELRQQQLQQQQLVQHQTLNLVAQMRAWMGGTLPGMMEPRLPAINVTGLPSAPLFQAAGLSLPGPALVQLQPSAFPGNQLLQQVHLQHGLGKQT